MIGLISTRRSVIRCLPRGSRLPRSNENIPLVEGGSLEPSLVKVRRVIGIGPGRLTGDHGRLLQGISFLAAVILWVFAPPFGFLFAVSLLIPAVAVVLCEARPALGTGRIARIVARLARWRLSVTGGAAVLFFVPLLDRLGPTGVLALYRSDAPLSVPYQIWTAMPLVAAALCVLAIVSGIQAGLVIRAVVDRLPPDRMFGGARRITAFLPSRLRLPLHRHLDAMERAYHERASQ